MSTRVVEVLVILAFAISLVIAIAFDGSTLARNDITLVEAYADQVRHVRQPFILFFLAGICAALSMVLGVGLFFANRSLARRFLIAAVALNLSSYPLVSVYADSSISGGAGFLLAVCLGWLIGVSRTERTRQVQDKIKLL